MRPVISVLICLALAACEVPKKPPPPARHSRELIVLTRNSSSTYYDNGSGEPVGLEHDLAMLFGKELGVPVKFIVAKQFDQILPDLAQHKAHLAAAGLSVTAEREKRVRFGPTYQTVQQQVIFNTDMEMPNSFQDLIGKRIEVVAGSSYAESLRQAKIKFKDLKWREIKISESEELLNKLAAGSLDAVIVDSNIYEIAQNFHPNLRVAFDVNKPQSLAWAFPRDVDPRFYARAVAFFKRIEQDGTLKQLIERYYGHVNRLEEADIAGILENMRSLLPKYRRLFHEAQELTGIDWRLLAALGYQESHWNALATSPTNVRGLMMLTEETADSLGVSNRLDARESILAGAEYLVMMKEMVPDRLTEPDRTWLALAAYNQGYGHLEDARILAQRHGLNPDAWSDVKQALPLLAKSEYFNTVKHGFARGGEPVIFVENIRTYYDILVKFEPAYKPSFSLVSSKDQSLVSQPSQGSRPHLSVPAIPTPH